VNKKKFIMTTMLYPLHELQRNALKPIAAWSQVIANALTHKLNPWADHAVNRRVAAAYGLLNRLGKDYEKPAWHLNETVLPDTGEVVKVEIDTVIDKSFCKLLHFRKVLANPLKVIQPTLLLVAPLSGHHATLLRDTVKSLIGMHEVYVTDWVDAKMVPVSEGTFHLDDYVAYVMEFIRHLHNQSNSNSGKPSDGVHVVSVCQPTVPVMAAVSLLSTLKDPAVPRTMILMGGPIDPRANPTTVNNLATRKPLSWFEENVIHAVPNNYLGYGRLVYPGFLQHTGFVAMNPDKHLKSHWDYFMDLIQGDEHDADAHRSFYDEYNAVLDLDADYYLDTIKIVFQEHRLPKGTWDVTIDGQTMRVNPADIKNVALFTIEGELDDISGSGQTQAAQGLCTNIADEYRQHFTAPQCGHYGIFSGKRWREVISPKIIAFIQEHHIKVQENSKENVQENVQENIEETVDLTKNAATYSTDSDLIAIKNSLDLF
jgi:poly(3-hydroxybutyrate) depolymerase